MKKKEMEKVPLEQAAIEEGKIPPTKGTKQMIVGITVPFKDQILSYLETRPYKEVAPLVEPLKQSKPFEVTFNGN